MQNNGSKWQALESVYRTAKPAERNEGEEGCRGDGEMERSVPDI